MTSSLRSLMHAGALPPLAYYFARFVAQGSGADEDSLLGQSAALVSVRSLHGDVCVELARYVGRPLFQTPARPEDVPCGPPLETWLAELEGARWVGAPSANVPLILERGRLYLAKHWRFEQQVADALRARLRAALPIDSARLADGLQRLFAGEDQALAWQRAAAAIAVGRRFAVISGGPGTGKTTTVAKVLALLREQEPALRIALAAPTGKAAARLSEALREGKRQLAPEAAAGIPEQASTIHRLLGFGRRGTFRFNRDNPLPVNCLVVDEASMIDLPLMAHLLDALPDAARLILLGDRDQLASVEAGNVLGDITGAGQPIRYGRRQAAQLDALGVLPPGVPVSAVDETPADAVGLLHVSYRFGADSGIGALARAANAGDGAHALALLDDPMHTDIEWQDTRRERLARECIDWAVEHYARCLVEHDVGRALARFETARVLAAVHSGPFGVEEINRRIEAGLTERGLIGGGEPYHGMPIMVTANDYELGLFNGDIGIIWRDDGGDTLRACFRRGADADADAVYGVPVHQLPDTACAYALTVHKAQGSEFDEVLLVLPHGDSPVLTRELVYTGVTRARRRLVVHGDRDGFVAGCERRTGRASALAHKLGWAADDDPVTAGAR